MIRKMRGCCRHLRGVPLAGGLKRRFGGDESGLKHILRRGGFRHACVGSRLMLREAGVGRCRLRRVTLFGALEREPRVDEFLPEGLAVHSFPDELDFDLGLSFGRLSRGILLGRGVLLGALQCAVRIGQVSLELLLSPRGIGKSREVHRFTL